MAGVLLTALVATHLVLLATGTTIAARKTMAGYSDCSRRLD